MPAPYPITTKYKVTAVDHGQHLKIGGVSDSDVGLWLVQFVPDVSWEGGLAVMARVDHKDAQADSVPYVQHRYRSPYLNTAPADYSMVDTVVTSGSILHIPASGLSIAFLASVVSGHGWLYSRPIIGATAL